MFKRENTVQLEITYKELQMLRRYLLIWRNKLLAQGHMMMLRSEAITETQFTRMAASILTAQKLTSAAIFVSAAALIQAEEFPPTVL